jgi:anhydro-N-acetylmuramic acid kinase
MGKIYTALGLMSGTSMDGVDASIINSDGNKEYSIKLNKYFEYGDDLRQKLINIRAKIFIVDHLKAYSDEIKELEREITLFHANAVNEILNNSKIDVDLLGFHGHTIFHNSKKKITKQLSDGKLLSQLTKKTVVYDFRQNDLKNGGQGAPLVPIFHNAMVNKFLKKELNASYSVNILNIGGISNISQTVKWEELDHLYQTMKACDIAPGNCLIDEWVRKNSKNKYDNDGKLGSIGKTDNLILNQALENFNIDLNYKESLDINDFDITFAKGLSLENGASTLTDFTAKQIIKALSYFGGSSEGTIWLVCGGGRKNKYLMKLITNKIKDVKKKIYLFPVEKYGIDGDFVESQAFAYLAIRSFLKLPISFPTTTGCKEPTIGGVMVKNF